MAEPPIDLEKLRTVYSPGGIWVDPAVVALIEVAEAAQAVVADYDGGKLTSRGSILLLTAALAKFKEPA